MKKKLKQIILILLVTSGISIVGFYFLHGIPLLGVPNAEDISYVEISHEALDESARIFTEKEDIEKSVNIISFLNYEIGIPEQQEPLVTITYHTKDGGETSVSANKETVYWNKRAYTIKGLNGTTFVKITEGLFFYDTLVGKASIK